MGSLSPRGRLRKKNTQGAVAQHLEPTKHREWPLREDTAAACFRRSSVDGNGCVEGKDRIAALGYSSRRCANTSSATPPNAVSASINTWNPWEQAGQGGQEGGVTALFRVSIAAGHHTCKESASSKNQRKDSSYLASLPVEDPPSKPLAAVAEATPRSLTGTV